MASLAGFANIGKVPELRRRVLYTLFMLAVYRVGVFVTIPGVDRNVMQSLMQKQGGGLLGMFNLFSGGALSNLSIFALGIMPYVSASIILQLLAMVFKPLEELRKEGEAGMRKINQYTRYGTLAISGFQGFLLARSVEGANNADTAGSFLGDVVSHPGWGFRIMTMITLTTGAAFMMWVGEQITERGVGNGISLIIFAGIVVRMPSAIFGLFDQLRSGNLKILTLIGILGFMVAIIALIVFVERAQRRIPVQYAKRVVGRRVYGGQNTYLPLRVNTGGVIPIIFAISIIQLPAYVAQLSGTDWMKKVSSSLGQGQPLYVVLYTFGILFFCYFYTSIVFNPTDTADNMRKYGGFIPGIRPGQKTADYIDTVLSRLTIIGALYLAFVALLPDFLASGFKVQSIPWIGPALDTVLPQFFTQGLNVPFYFGGTSLLIVVGVAMDTVQQVESKLVEHHYTGFLKKSRIRGRRS